MSGFYFYFHYCSDCLKCRKFFKHSEMELHPLSHQHSPQTLCSCFHVSNKQSESLGLLWALTSVTT